MPITKTEIDRRFDFHKASAEQTFIMDEFRLQVKALSNRVTLWTPESREQSNALTSLETALVWINKAITGN